MVGITAVYVIATIFICRANIKASEAAKEQLEEMRKQYEADNRPIIETEVVFQNRVFCALRFVNNGKHTAQHVKVELSKEFIDSLPNGSIKNILEKDKNKECIIGVGQHHDIFIGDSSLKTRHDLKPIQGVVLYESSGIKYSSEIYVDLENYMTFLSTDTDEEKLREAIKENTKALKEIRNALKNNPVQQQSLYSYLISGGEENSDA